MTQPEKDPTPPLQGPPTEEDETNTSARSMSLTPNNRSEISQRNGLPPEQPLLFKDDNEDTSSFCSPRKWTMLGIVLVVIACVIVVVLVNANDDDAIPTSSPSLRR
jgi:hypothetical protein